MKNDKKKKSKTNKTTEKTTEEKQETKATTEKDDGPRIKGIKLLDKLFEEKTAEEILSLSHKHDVMGLGPLSMVAAMGHVTGVRKLLEAGVGVNEPSSMDGETPLTLSARSKHSEVVELLLQNGADISITNNEGDNAFMIAIKVGDPKIVNTMWAYRGQLNVNHKNKNAITALHYAAERGWESCVQFLVMQGADVNARDMNGSSPLIVASIRGDQRTVEALLKAGCNVLIEDNAGCTAVCRALQAEKTALTEFFVKKLTDLQADNFIKARAERLRRPEISNHEVGYFYNHVLFPMFEELSKYENYRELLYRHKIIPHAILAVGRYVNDPETMAAVCQIFSVLMYHYPTFVEERFALQFIRSGGPELIVRALKSFSECKSANPSMQEEGVCFLPLLAACEVTIGRDWLQKNSMKVTPFTRNFEASLDTIDFPDDGSRLKARVLWTRFRSFFDGMIKSQCEQQEAELLQEEEREKMRKEKKREKKRQRRQRQNQLKQDQTVDTEEQMDSPEGNFLNLESTNLLSGPVLGDSDNEEDDSKEELIIKTETMESFVNKMKSYFANPLDCDQEDSNVAIPMQENNMAATQEMKIAHKDIGELLRPSTKKCPNGGGNINGSCADSVTEENSKATTEMTDGTDQSSNTFSGGELDSHSLSGHNEVQEGGLYATEGFYDPTVLLADPITGESTWTTVGAKKNNQRGPESGAPDTWTNTKKKQKKKKKKADDHVSSKVAPARYPTSQTKGLNKGNVWAPMADAEDWESESYGFLPTNTNPNYEDEFPSLTATPKQKTKNQSKVLRQDNEYQKPLSHEPQPEKQNNDKDDDQSSGSGDSLSTESERETCEQEGTSDWFSYSGNLEGGHAPWVDGAFVLDGDEIEPQAEAENLVSNVKPQTLSGIAGGLPEKQAAHANSSFHPGVSAENVNPWGTSDSYCADYVHSLQNEIPLDRNFIYTNCVGNEITSPDPTNVPDVLRYWQNTQQLSVAPRSAKPIDIHEARVGMGSDTKKLDSSDLKLPIEETQAAKISEHQQFVGNRENRTVPHSFAQARLHPQTSTIHGIGPPPGLTENDSQTSHGANNPMSMHGGRTSNSVWQFPGGKQEQVMAKHLSSNYAATSRVGPKPDVVEVYPSPTVGLPEQPPASSCFVEAYTSDGNQQAINETATRGFQHQQQEPLDMSLHETQLLANTVPGCVYPTEEAIQHATKLCAQQIATLAGLRHQRAMLDAKARDAPRMEAHQTRVAPRMGDHKPSKPCGDAYQRLLEANYGVQADNSAFLKSTFPQASKQALSTFDDASLQQSPIYDYLNDGERDSEKDKSPVIEAPTDFPKFHDPMPEAWPFAAPVPNMDPLEVLKMEQVRQWRRQLGNGFNDNPLSSDYHYYYSALGQQAKGVLDSEFGATSMDGIFKLLDSKAGHTNARNTNMANKAPADLSKIHKDEGNGVRPPFKEKKIQEVTIYNGVNWIPKSPRWRKKLQEMLEYPQRNCRLVGCIRIPNDVERFSLRQGNNKTTLGLLTDGREVAVSRVRVDQISRVYKDLNGLLSEDTEHLFLVKYLVVEQKNQFCYVATELCEYTIEEYIKIVHLNHRLDPLSADRIVWQVLKGLKHLHDNCKMLHHNLRPSNILIDMAGKVKISDYGQNNSIQPRTSSETIPDRDSRCWQACEVLVSNSDTCYSVKSDIQVSGMLMYYILSGGDHPYGKTPCEIETNICRNWHSLMNISEEANDMVLSMLSYTPLSRPTISEALRHPYFWSEEKRFRFLLIVGSDILKELKGGSSGSSVTDHLNIIYAPAISTDWIAEIDAELVQEMSQFRQYRNSIAELLLFLYNCCLHFDKLSAETHDILDDPCKYFNTKFPALFMAVYRILRTSETVTARKCYKSFF